MLKFGGLKTGTIRKEIHTQFFIFYCRTTRGGGGDENTKKKHFFFHLFWKNYQNLIKHEKLILFSAGQNRSTKKGYKEMLSIFSNIIMTKTYYVSFLIYFKLCISKR